MTKYNSSAPKIGAHPTKVPLLHKEGGEGGNPAPSTPLPADNAEFLRAIFTDLSRDEVVAVCSKKGDPSAGAWIAEDAENVRTICPSNQNNYFCSATLHRGAEGALRATVERAAAYHVVMLDDVGTKGDFPAVPPTYGIETSLGNYQLGFVLAEPLTNSHDVERLQNAITVAGMSDKGAKGMTRWARLPFAVNGKPKHFDVDGRPFPCRVSHWNPELRYSVDELAEQLGLTFDRPKQSAITGNALPRPKQLVVGDDVYTPRPAVNPVLAALKECGLYKKEISPGKHDITCPWVGEHTDGQDTGAAYFEPSDGRAIGGFRCQHSHGDRYNIRNVIDHLGVSANEARGRALIRLVAGELNRVVEACETVLALQGTYYQAGGVIVTIGKDPNTGDLTIVPVGEPSLTKALSAAADFEKFDNRGASKWVRCDPPQRHVMLVSRAESYEHLPPLKGLARQPYFREQDGKLITQPGYDPVSGLFAEFDPAEFVLPEPTERAAQESLGLLRDLLREFRFNSEYDEATALAAILTAVVRPSLKAAPGFHTRAPSMSSGKSTLNAVIGQFAGPGPNLNVTYPYQKEEAVKVILALLLTGPAVIDFDDMDHDWFPHGIVKRMFTNATITDRILGVSKTATVSTRTLFLGSGNNVGPQRDLLRRVMVINLNARTDSAVTIHYEGRPLETLRANRGRYVAAALTIILAWQRAGEPRTSVPNLASYGTDWADYCRHPLIWQGLPDPAAGLFEQVRHDPDADNLAHLLSAWHAMFGDKPMTVRKLLKEVYDRGDGDLLDALLELPFVERDEVNRSKMGGFLKRHANRIVDGFELQKAPNSERNAWRVVSVANDQSPPSPPLPPKSGPSRENGGADTEIGDD